MKKEKEKSRDEMISDKAYALSSAIDDARKALILFHHCEVRHDVGSAPWVMRLGELVKAIEELGKSKNVPLLLLRELNKIKKNEEKRPNT